MSPYHKTAMQRNMLIMMGAWVMAGGSERVVAPSWGVSFAFTKRRMCSFQPAAACRASHAGHANTLFMSDSHAALSKTN